MFLLLFQTLGYFAGGLEILLYSWMIFYIFLFLVEKPPLKNLVLPGICLLFSVLLSSCQFLITYNFIQHSYRVGQDFNNVNQQFKNLLLFPLSLFPWLPGKTNNLSVCYCGFIQLLGFICAVKMVKDKWFSRAVFLIIFFSLIFVANIWPLNHLFSIVPILKFGRAGMHYRIFFPTIIICIIYSAGGISEILYGARKQPILTIAGGFVFYSLFLALFIGADLYLLRTFTLLAASRVVLILLLFANGWMFIRSFKLSRNYELKPGILIVILIADMFVLSYLGMHRYPTDCLTLKEELSFQFDDKKYERIHLISPLYDDLQLWKTMRLDRGPGFIFSYIENGVKNNHEIFNRMIKNDLFVFSPEIIRHEMLPLINYLSVKYVVSHSAPLYLQDPDPIFSIYNKSSYYENGKYIGRFPGTNNSSIIMVPGSTWNVSMQMMAGDRIKAFLLHSPGEIPPLEILKDSKPMQINFMGTMSGNDTSKTIDSDLEIEKKGTHIISISAMGNEQFELIDPRIENNNRPFNLIGKDQFQYYRNNQAQDVHKLYFEFIEAKDEEAFEIIFNPDKFDSSRQLILMP